MITINGKSYNGNSIVISNNKVIIDGNDCTPDSKDIKIEVVGNIESIKADCCNYIKVTGDSGNIQSQSGDIEIEGNVSGNVSTMSGNVDCGNIQGSVSTMSGNIKYKK